MDYDLSIHLQHYARSVYQSALHTTTEQKEKRKKNSPLGHALERVSEARALEINTEELLLPVLIKPVMA